MKQRLRRRFRVLVALQVVLLAASLAALVASIVYGGLIVVPAVIAAVVVVQLVILVRSVQAHVDALEEFFAAVNYEDFTRRFVTGDVDAELREEFNRVIERFQDARADRDLQAGYLDTVVRHIPVPFIAVRADGSLSLVNNPARRLTGLPGLRHIDDIAAVDPQLPAALSATAPGETRLLQTALRDVPVELRVSVAEIRMDGSVERLYSIENLSGELSARESSAWRSLIRVLTHEIMNTLTPVTSLAETTLGLLDSPGAGNDVREALTTIGRRSDNLIRFVARYRELLKVPEPKPEVVSVQGLLDNVATLMRPDLGGIELTVEVRPESLQLSADPQLVEQVLINLVRNAADALAETNDARIEMTGRLDPGRTVLAVRDNGPGIPEDDRDQIFIPFFTTRRDGSGIGLSLSRQIMTAHGGEILVATSTAGTEMRLVFS